ncbi:MAG: hypothetical protein F6K28_60060 [Microcoleus sp. SIO2G3]|nr:hypothetical protein [Microcoleus sp. SIO2G3]
MTNSNIFQETKKIVEFQKKHPEIDCTIQVYVEKVGWRFIDLKTMKRYDPISFKEAFGYEAVCSHPEALNEENRLIKSMVRKHPKPKGFGK